MPEQDAGSSGSSKRSSQVERTANLGEQRYSENELGLIFKRAAELQEEVAVTATSRARSANGFTLAETQQIALDVGISPQHIATAASSLRSNIFTPKGSILGPPSRLRFERSIDGEISNDVVCEMIDCARRETGSQGSVTALGTTPAVAAGLPGPLAALAGFAGVGGGSWLTARTYWSRYARKWAGRTCRLEENLAEFAERSINERRTAESDNR
ncbi:MAG: hypothetical protein ABJC26_11740 [Gemmatimonadaceae bacterium]